MRQTLKAGQVSVAIVGRGNCTGRGSREGDTEVRNPGCVQKTRSNKSGRTVECSDCRSRELTLLMSKRLCTLKTFERTRDMTKAVCRIANFAE